MADDEGMIRDDHEKYLMALLVATAFSALGWMIPAAAIHITPASDHVQIESVSVNQTSNTTHNVTISYKSREKYPVEAAIVLYKDGSNGSDVAMETWTVQTIIPPGEHKGSLQLDTKEPLPSGEYYYQFDLTIHTGYNIEKKYSYSTDSFPIENSSSSSMICCGASVPLQPD